MLPEVDVSDDRCKPAASEEHLDKVASRAHYEANAEQAHKVHVVLHPLTVHEGVWYEPPTTLSAGAVTPIALAFGTLMTFAQMRELSRHAYVAGIEPAFGDVA